MTDFSTSPRPKASSDDIDLAQVLIVLRRAALPIAIAPILVGGATYILFRQQPPVYESVTTLMAAQPDNVGTTLNGASVSSPPLPQGAVQEIVNSRSVMTGMAEQLKAGILPAEYEVNVQQDLQQGIAAGKNPRVSVKARLDNQQRGVYELRSRAESPEAARQIADAAAAAVLSWDLTRAKQGVTRARQNLQQQLNNLTQRLQGLPEGSVERQSLVAARGQLLLDLSQATVLEEGAVGSLTLLAEANAPRIPVAPKPLRNAALAGLLTLFTGAGLALLRDSLRRRVRSVNDIVNMGLPTLGELPLVTRIARTKTVNAVTRGALYEPAGFIRVNVAAVLPEQGAILTVTSARPGEGKSTVTAAIAAAYSLASKRVLVIDLDVHRPVQHQFWSIAGRPWVALPGAQQSHQTTLLQALEHPEQGSAVAVTEHVHLLPAGEAASSRRVLALINSPSFPDLLRRWATGYDVVIIDTPPVLSVADAFVIARHTDGLAMVVEGGGTSIPELQRAVRTAESSQTPFLGVILNKIRRNEQSYYTYSYAQQR